MPARKAQRHFERVPSREEFVAERAPEDAPGGTSINAAATALQELFATLISGGALQMNEIAKAGDQVIDAITGVGLAQWLDTVRSYHDGTFQHCLLVTGVATAFGQRQRMRKSDIAVLTMAGLLHDIGKAQIPLNILDKPKHLTDEEFSVIQSHPVIGYEYLVIQNAILRDILDAVRHHHEYLDGSGYPDGLRGDEVKDLTRVLTICDVYGALIERRAYKPPKSSKEAVDILTKMAGEKKIEADLVRALSQSVSADLHLA